MPRARVPLAAAIASLAIAAALVGGCAVASGGGAANAAPTDGAGLVAELCSQCHPASRIDAANKDRDGWTRAVSRMESHGLVVTDQQRQSIIDYLTKRDGGS